jgi:hypothetical protein
VFQHIASMEVITSYCREVQRALKPGSLFKFQVQGSGWERSDPSNTWTGVSKKASRGLCKETGFTLERDFGTGSELFWLWFPKPFWLLGQSDESHSNSISRVFTLRGMWQNDTTRDRNGPNVRGLQYGIEIA